MTTNRNAPRPLKLRERMPFGRLWRRPSLLALLLPTLLAACAPEPPPLPSLRPQNLPQVGCSIFLPYSGPLSEVQPLPARAHLAGLSAAYGVYCPDGAKWKTVTNVTP